MHVSAENVTREYRFIVLAILVLMGNFFLIMAGLSRHAVDSGEATGLFFTTVPVIVLWVVLWMRWKYLGHWTTAVFLGSGWFTFLMDMTALFLVLDCLHCVNIFWISAASLMAAASFAAVSAYLCCACLPRLFSSASSQWKPSQDNKYTFVRPDPSPSPPSSAPASSVTIDLDESPPATTPVFSLSDDK